MQETQKTKEMQMNSHSSLCEEHLIDRENRKRETRSKKRRKTPYICLRNWKDTSYGPVFGSAIQIMGFHAPLDFQEGGM